MRNGVRLRWGVCLVWGPPAPPPVLCNPLCVLTCCSGVGSHVKDPGALAITCAVGPRGGSGAFLVDYAICFSF